MSEIPKPSWITPGLVVQLVTVIVSITFAWATLSNRLDQMQERLTDIRQQLPNKELYDERMTSIRMELRTLTDKVNEQDAWIRNTRERLAEKGWKP